MIEYEKWCRLCAQIKGSDFDVIGENAKCPELRQLISKYLGLTITPEDNYPQFVCKNCTSRLKGFDSFAIQCTHAQNMFSAILTRDTPLDQEQLTMLRSEYNVDDYKTFLDNSIEIDNKDNISLLLSNALQQSEAEIVQPSRRTGRARNAGESGKFEVVIVKKEEDDSDDDDNRHVDGNDNDDDEDDEEYFEPKEPPKRARGRPPKGSSKSIPNRKVKPFKIKKEYDSEDDLEKDTSSDSDFNPNEDQTVSEVKKEKPIRQKRDDSVFKYFRWECFICDDAFKTFGRLQTHCREIHDTNPKISCVCGKILSTKTTLRRHRLLHSNNYLKCTQCRKVFTKESYLNAHMKSHIPKEELPYVCYHCGARFTTEARLRRHEVAHIPNEERQIWPCPHCDKRFMKRQAVDIHIKGVHLKEKPFVCHECGRAFTSKGTLNEHLLIHTDIAPHVCHCGKRFKTAHRLKLHSDTHQETTYKCPVCALTLNTRRTLRQHLVIHRDVRAYTCSICHKGFKRYKGLKTHEILHSGRRPYSCPFCDRTFTNGSNCRSHKRRMHPEELAAYEAGLASAGNILQEHMESDSVSPINPQGIPVFPGPAPPQTAVS